MQMNNREKSILNKREFKLMEIAHREEFHCICSCKEFLHKKLLKK